MGEIYWHVSMTDWGNRPRRVSSELGELERTDGERWWAQAPDGRRFGPFTGMEAGLAAGKQKLKDYAVNKAVGRSGWEIYRGEGVPAGAVKVEAWLHDGHLVVVGRPNRAEDAPEEWHNCDAMGCSRSHVVLRTPVDRYVEQALTPPDDFKDRGDDT